jgi:phenylacetate-CoA ligase
MGLAERIYAHLPAIGQDLAASAFGLYRYWMRFGPGYEAELAGYREREFWTCEQLQAFQKQRLRRLLQVAAEHVPYYRETWSDGQKAAARAGVLAELPLLGKEPIRAAPARFARIDERPRPRFKFHTSGSSGTPIVTYWSAAEVRESRALRESRSANWAGTSFREGRATFSGRLVVPDPHSGGPFHRFNRVENQVYFSAFHLSAHTAPQYVQALAEHRTQWLTGYAVSYYLLARHILNGNIRVPPLKAVITTSEKVTPEMRAVMEQAYGCRVFEEYSTVENAVFASECEHGRLHVSSDSGVVEILRSDGTPCDPGEPGEVVATSFVRRHQPFIRYRLGDLAAWDWETCPCGRNMPVLKEVVGRVEDVVLGPDGRQMVRFHGIFVGIPNLLEGQVIQEALERIRVKVVPVVGFGERDVTEIQKRIRQRLGDVEVTVEPVSEIPRTKAGKFRAVVSLLQKQA